MKTPSDLENELRQPGRMLVFTDDTGTPVDFGHLRVLVSVPIQSHSYPEVCDELESIRRSLGVEVLHGKEIRRGTPDTEAARLAAYRDWCRCLARHGRLAAFTYLNDQDPSIVAKREKPSVRASVPKQLLGRKALIGAGHHAVVLAAVRGELLDANLNDLIIAVEDASKAQRGRITAKRLRDINAPIPTSPPLVLGNAIYKADDADINGLQLADLAAHSLMRLRGIVRHENTAPGSFDVEQLDPFDRLFWEEIYAKGFEFENVHQILEAADRADPGAASVASPR